MGLGAGVFAAESFLFLEAGGVFGEGGGGEVALDALTEGFEKLVLGAEHEVVAPGKAHDATVEALIITNRGI